jgi:hypothetical protein
VLTILSPNLPRIPLRRPALEQLLNSLVAHAGNSLPRGGTVTVITAVPPVTGPSNGGRRVTLAVQANGEEVQEPLSPDVEAFVERCKGKFSVTLDAQVGLIFEIVLPAESMQ